jgi:hypothetical protein
MGWSFVLNAMVFAYAGGPRVLVVLSAFTGLAALATALAELSRPPSGTTPSPRD